MTVPEVMRLDYDGSIHRINNLIIRYVEDVDLARAIGDALLVTNNQDPHVQYDQHLELYEKASNLRTILRTGTQLHIVDSAMAIPGIAENDNRSYHLHKLKLRTFESILKGVITYPKDVDIPDELRRGQLVERYQKHASYMLGLVVNGQPIPDDMRTTCLKALRKYPRTVSPHPNYL